MGRRTGQPGEEEQGRKIKPLRLRSPAWVHEAVEETWRSRSDPKDELSPGRAEVEHTLSRGHLLRLGHGEVCADALGAHGACHRAGQQGQTKLTQP